MKRAIAFVAAGLLAAGPAAPHAAAPAQLKYVVVLTRHGVRAPTWTTDRLNQYSAEPWPNWGVEPGNLTPHGRAAMMLFGAYYGEWLASEGLLERDGCRDESRISIWADVDERTVDTGHAIADGLRPGCSLPVGSQADASADALFDPIATGLAMPDPALAARAVRERIDGDPSSLLESHRPAFATLDRVLADGRSTKARVNDGTPIAVSASAKGADLTGPLATASTLSENLLLEYANGFSGSDLGWGRLDSSTLVRALELHATYADLARKTPYVARARGSNLVAHILRSIQQAVDGVPIRDALGRAGDAVLILSGHDTNLSNVSGLLGLTWHLPGYQPDDTPPGGALVFSLWKDTSAGTFVVRTQYVAQSLDQMRNLVPLTLAAPPESETVLDSDWESFSRLLTHAIDPKFTNVRGF